MSLQHTVLMAFPIAPLVAVFFSFKVEPEQCPVNLNAMIRDRSIDELVGSALSETNEELLWQAITVLHCRGTEDVLTQAKRLSASSCNRERRLGADILGQLGVPERTLRLNLKGLHISAISAEAGVASHSNEILWTAALALFTFPECLQPSRSRWMSLGLRCDGQCSH